MIIAVDTVLKKLCFLVRVHRIRRAFRKLNKAEERRMKATKEREWIEENEHIHIINYPYYKTKRWLKSL